MLTTAGNGARSTPPLSPSWPVLAWRRCSSCLSSTVQLCGWRSVWKRGKGWRGNLEWSDICADTSLHWHLQLCFVVSADGGGWRRTGHFWLICSSLFLKILMDPQSYGGAGDRPCLSIHFIYTRHTQKKRRDNCSSRHNYSINTLYNYLPKRLLWKRFPTKRLLTWNAADPFVEITVYVKAKHPDRPTSITREVIKLSHSSKE